MTNQDHADQDARLAGLIAAEDRAFALLEAIEARGIVRPGRTEKDVEKDILALAESDFGVEQHWHKRIVRAGINTLAVFAENPPVRVIGNDDVVFLDLGPVFDDWEADVGKTYAFGDDPKKHALVAELPRQFALIKAKLDAEPDITGADLYRHAVEGATAAGWTFGGAIAGHIVAEFPHARLPGERQIHHISAENPFPLSAPDPLGRARHWIIEVHLVAPDGSFGGFYERLAHGPNRER
ncbi:MAG: M24 family metallopeptidase [Sphingomonas sp.]